MEALVVLANGFEDRIGADDIGVDEGPWIAQRIVIVALGGKMHDDVAFTD